MKNSSFLIDKIKIAKVFSILLVLFFGFILKGSAQDVLNNTSNDKTDKKDAPVLSSVYKEVEGEISAVDKYGVAIITKRDLAKGEENEIYIPFEKTKLRLIHKTKLDEIKVGDIVKVGYEIINEENKQGPRARFDGQTITFLKPAEKKLLPPEPPAEVTDDSEVEMLPLKGVRQ